MYYIVARQICFECIFECHAYAKKREVEFRDNGEKYFTLNFFGNLKFDLEKTMFVLF